MARQNGQLALREKWQWMIPRRFPAVANETWVRRELQKNAGLLSTGLSCTRRPGTLRDPGTTQSLAQLTLPIAFRQTEA